MPSETKVFRGQYGPSPVDSVSEATMRSAWIRLAQSTLKGRCLWGLRSLSPSETQQIRQVAERASFPMWQPDRVPRGFKLLGSEVAPYSRDAVTVSLTDRRGLSFEIVQRRRWLSTLEELTVARLPFHQIPFTRDPLFCVYGRHGGEPIDHAYWSSRQSLHFERGGLALELRTVKDRGPGLAVLIHYAHWACRHDIANDQSTKQNTGG